MSIKFVYSGLGVKPDLGVELPARTKAAVCLIILCILSAFLVGCSTKTKTEAVQATIKITKIVDNATQRLINSNIVTPRWETPEGKVIKTEAFRNQSQFSTTMPADGSVRLFVIVEAVDLSISDLENIPSIVIFYGTRPGDYSSSKAAYLGHCADTNVYVVSAHLIQ